MPDFTREEVIEKVGAGEKIEHADLSGVERLSGTSIGFTVDTVYEALSSMRALHMIAESQR